MIFICGIAQVSTSAAPLFFSAAELANITGTKSYSLVGFIFFILVF